MDSFFVGFIVTFLVCIGLVTVFVIPYFKLRSVTISYEKMLMKKIAELDAPVELDPEVTQILEEAEALLKKNEH